MRGSGIDPDSPWAARLIHSNSVFVRKARKIQRCFKKRQRIPFRRPGDALKRLWKNRKWPSVLDKYESLI